MAAAVKLAQVVTVGLESGKGDQVALGEMGEAREVEGTHSQTQLSSLHQFARQLHPTFLGQLIGAQALICHIQGRLNWLSDRSSWPANAVAPKPIKKNCH